MNLSCCDTCQFYIPTNGKDDGEDCYKAPMDVWFSKVKPGNACPYDAYKRKPQYVEIPETGIGDLSDGYHTFNGLYYQRMVLFAALVRAYKDRAWKSWKHEDGEPCFGGGWFIVGIDTPDGSYTYHYEEKDWPIFDCEELPVAKHWDGHTEEDVTRLYSLPVPATPIKDGVTISGTSDDINTILQTINPDYPRQNLENAGSECAYGIGGVWIKLHVRQKAEQENKT